VIRRLALLVAFSLILAVVGALGSLYLPYKAFGGEVFLDFDKGTSTRAMAAQLAKAGVIRCPWQFLAARVLHPRARLQAGEYRFSEPATVVAVFSRISRGDIYYHEITVPEGSNIFDISAIVERSGLIAGPDFLHAAADVKLIRDLDPRARTLEGYLFPSTYRVTRRTTVEQLVRMMLDEFRKEWKKAIAGVSPPPDVHNTVTLASLVEKETAVPSERPLVASVYSNRLRIGMKLDCDPTTIYAALLEDRYRGTIYRSDLASDNAYNTYQHPGLPPGPIANPGVASLKAAVSPARTDYLYFVAKADGSGAHTFSKDYRAHERAVEAYRRGQAKTGTPR
jgi:UPF0755 protein